MAFHQTYNGPIGQILNVEGTVVLGDKSSISDLIALMDQQRRLIQNDPALTEPASKQAAQSISAAIDEASKPKPDKLKVSDYVNEAAKIVEGAGATTSGLVSLAEMLFKIGKWATVFL